MQFASRMVNCTPRGILLSAFLPRPSTPDRSEKGVDGSAGLVDGILGVSDFAPSFRSEKRLAGLAPRTPLRGSRESQRPCLRPRHSV